MWDADKEGDILELRPRAPFVLGFYFLLKSSGVEGGCTLRC